MVGPYNDHGWSEASYYDAGLYVEKHGSRNQDDLY